MDKKSKPVRKKTLTVVYKESIFVNMRYHVAYQLLMLLGTVIGCLVLGCSNSEGVNNEVVAFWDIEEDGASFSAKIDYLPLDDSEYPYAGIPRIVIETENHREIKDRETEIPAKLQIWGEHAPESEIMDLTIRGRGNTSWGMPKKSYKIEFINKQSMLGMPKDRDWALIANYADKTLMKNYLMYHLSAKLGAYYAPRCEFVEFYLNNEYLGVYLLTETIKKTKKRVNISDSNSYIVEVDAKYRDDEQVVFSKVIKQNSLGKAFRIHYPKKASETALHDIETHIQSFETFLKDSIKTSSNLSQWIDVNEYVKHYWVQEFSKNPDACFNSSIFFSWTKDNIIKMGPVWDFDLAMGNYDNKSISSPQDWHIKESYWNDFIFRDSIAAQAKIDFWTENKLAFKELLNAIDSIQVALNKAAKNNFKKWIILQNTSFIYHPASYKSYQNATEDLKKWIIERYSWIDSQL